MGMKIRTLLDGTKVPTALMETTLTLLKELKEISPEAFEDFYDCCCHLQLSLANRHMYTVRGLNLIGSDRRIQENVAFVVQNAVKRVDGELVIDRPYDPTVPGNNV